jgi:hypothetical protein
MEFRKKNLKELGFVRMDQSEYSLNITDRISTGCAREGVFLNICIETQTCTMYIHTSQFNNNQTLHLKNVQNYESLICFLGSLS